MTSSNELPVIEIEEPLGIYAREVRERGLEYWRAFKRLTAESDTDFKYVNYFLLAHGLELILKSFLHAHGIKKRDLKARSIRHAPLVLLDRCCALGLPSVPHLRDLSAALGEMNSDHDFRYPSGYNLHLPSYRLCIEVFENLVDSTEVAVSTASVEAQLKFAEDTRHLKGKAKIRWSD